MSAMALLWAMGCVIMTGATVVGEIIHMPHEWLPMLSSILFAIAAAMRQRQFNLEALLDVR